MLMTLMKSISIVRYFSKIKTAIKMEANSKKYPLYDIAANLTSDEFFGHYHGKQAHPEDIDIVIQRAKNLGCDRLLIASGHLEDAEKSYVLCQKDPKFFNTIGVHPCRANEPHDKTKYPSVESYFQKLEETYLKMTDKVVAIGECGLDYDRFNYASKEQQLAVFPHHFAMTQKYKLPMYLHNRNTGNDFYEIIRQNRYRFTTGVVHSFTGPLQELKQILELDLYVGINGCSLKTAENLEVVKHVPLDRIMLETDAPYCEIRNSHASSGLVQTKFNWKQKEKYNKDCLVKGRNEPCTIIQVLQVVSSLLKVSKEELAQAAYNNSVKILAKH